MKASHKYRFVGLTGTNGAGKGEAAAFLKERGYNYYSLSDVIREELAARGEEPNRDNLIRAGNELRRLHGPDVLARRVAEKAKAPAVIDSIRNAAEVARLRRLEGFVLVALDAPLETRFERVRSRGRDESASTLEEFRRKEELERAGDDSSQQLEKCLAEADFLVWNDGGIADLRRKLEELLT
jgi:dephospho-CoA kinase